MQSQPETLVSRIFKARYYRMGEFYTAELGHNPSFIWRSVLEVRDVGRMGARRRVGNGEEINIINDPWLPCEDNLRVTCVHPSLVGKNVSTLFETGTLAWDKDLVLDLFNRRDAELISSITLSQSRNKDRWYWSLEKTGLFSVKSAYRYIQSTKEEEVSAAASDFWKRMWKVRVPPKVKHMLWRATTNCLPTKSLLRSRHVSVDEICPLCKVQRETVVHCLINCTFAQSCWNVILGETVTTAVGSFAAWLNDRGEW